WLYMRGQLAVAPIHGLPLSATIQSALTYWSEARDHIARTPLFPVKVFSQYLEMLCKIDSDCDQLLQFARTIDVLVGERFGALAAGESARDRAVMLLEKERYLAALEELHVLKQKWFTKESLGGSVVAMRLIGDCYRHLGLYMAAKQ